jgi:ATP-dependent helicase HepA
MPFAPGQRWISAAEPELGLGTVLRIDGRTVQVLFARTGVLRHYATQSAPLLRATFQAGDTITANGAALRVETVEEREGVLHYAGGGRTVAEGRSTTCRAFRRRMTGWSVRASMRTTASRCAWRRSSAARRRAVTRRMACSRRAST